MPGEVGRLPRQLRWCGMALIAGGVLMVVATLLHPSYETPPRLAIPCNRREHRRLGWSAADPAGAIVAARVCLTGRGLLPAANEHDIAQQQRISPQSLLRGRVVFWPVLDLHAQVRLAGAA
jgi:hypothetical protein